MRRFHQRAFGVLVLLPCLCLGITVSAHAAETAALDLPALLATALRDNKDLQAARGALAIGQARLQQAGLRENPTLDLGLQSDFLFGHDGVNSQSVGISQSFPVAGRLRRQQDVARVDIALAEAEIADGERKLAGEVMLDAWHWALLDRRLAAIQERQQAQAELLRTARARFRAAEVSELNVNSARIEQQRLQQEQDSTQGEREALRMDLNLRLGRAAATPLALRVELPDRHALPDLPLAQQRALRQRADLRAALLSADRAAAEKALAQASRWQDWTVGLSVTQDHQVILGAPEQGHDRVIGLSLSIPLPLRDTQQGRIAEADATHDQALARAEALQLAIANEVAVAHARATREQAALAQFDSELLPAAAANARLAQQGYGQGLLPLTERVQVQRQQNELEADYLARFDNYLQALAELRTATGDVLVGTETDSLPRGTP